MEPFNCILEMKQGFFWGSLFCEEDFFGYVTWESYHESSFLVVDVEPESTVRLV